MRRLRNVHLHYLQLSRCDALQSVREKAARPVADADSTEDRLAESLTENVTAVAAIAPMLCEPDVKTTQVSQLLHGHIAEVIERRGLWLHVRSADEYDGWVHQGYVVTVPDKLASLGATGWDAPLPLSLGCTVRDAQGATRKLPLGALLTEGEERVGGLAMNLEERRHSFPPAAESIIASATTFFEGTSYEWGGVTPWGCDCSGLVHSSFHLHGVHVPRDAWQQATTGEPVDAIEDVRPGDLLFFSDEPEGKITHVAISMGGTRVVHLALGRGGYAIDDLASGDDYTNLLLERFRFARRILDERSTTT